jgi:hypothetical protein
LKLSLLAIRHRKAVRQVSRAARGAALVTATVKQATADPRVAAEIKLALADVAGASQRAREVGVTNVYRDEQLSAALRHASSHLSGAVDAARHPRRSHRLARALAVAAGAGAVGSVAYASWRAISRPTTV